MPRRQRQGTFLGPLLAALCLAGGVLLPLGTPTLRAQEEVPAASIPVPLSQRLRAQGYTVEAAEAAYLDADERVTETFVQPLVVVLAFADQPQRVGDWRSTVTPYLRQLTRLDPANAPVIPPAALLPAHGQSIAYREHLRAAAQAWLDGIEANDPAWLQWGLQEYGLAESARVAWHRALWERYAGQPRPGP